MNLLCSWVVWVCYVSKPTRGERAEPRFNTLPPGAVLITATNLGSDHSPLNTRCRNPLLDGVLKHLSCHVIIVSSKQCSLLN